MTRTVPLALLLLAAALAGCADDPQSVPLDTDPIGPGGEAQTPAATTPTPPLDGTTGDEDLPEPVPNATAPGGLRLSLTAPDGALRTDAWTLHGTVGHDATVTLELLDGDAATPLWTGSADGAWNVTVAVPFGQSVLRATADDGTETVQATVALVREAQGTLQVHYRGDVGLDDRDDTFWLDVDAWPSAPLYEGCDVRHPDHATVHDAMLAWQAQTGVDVTYGDCGQFGVSVEAIDGHENPGFWCFTIDGEASEFGISLAPWKAGEVIAWDDCVLVLG